MNTYRYTFVVKKDDQTVTKRIIKQVSSAYIKDSFRVLKIFTKKDQILRRKISIIVQAKHIEQAWDIGLDFEEIITMK